MHNCRLTNQDMIFFSKFLDRCLMATMHSMYAKIYGSLCNCFHDREEKIQFGYLIYGKFTLSFCFAQFWLSHLMHLFASRTRPF